MTIENFIRWRCDKAAVFHVTYIHCSLNAHNKMAQCENVIQIMPNIRADLSWNSLRILNIYEWASHKIHCILSYAATLATHTNIKNALNVPKHPVKFRTHKKNIFVKRKHLLKFHKKTAKNCTRLSTPILSHCIRPNKLNWVSNPAAK